MTNVVRLVDLGRTSSRTLTPGTISAFSLKNLPVTTTPEMVSLAIRQHMQNAPDDVVAETLGVPTKNLSYWTKQRDWGFLAHQVAADIRADLYARVGRGFNTVVDALIDRITFGERAVRTVCRKRATEHEEAVYEDVEYRVPMTSKSLTAAAKLLAEMFDEHGRGMEGRGTKLEDKRAEVMEWLKNAVQPQGETIEGERADPFAEGSGEEAASPS